MADDLVPYGPSLLQMLFELNLACIVIPSPVTVEKITSAYKEYKQCQISS